MRTETIRKSVVHYTCRSCTLCNYNPDGGDIPPSNILPKAYVVGRYEISIKIGRGGVPL